MRPAIAQILEGLLAATEDARSVTLDAIGDAIGAAAITPDEIDELMSSLEAQGRVIVAPSGNEGEQRLRAVVSAARSLGPELGRKPTLAEIADRSGLAPVEVQHALALLRVMQR